MVLHPRWRMPDTAIGSATLQGNNRIMVFEPIPSASVSTATKVKPGLLRRTQLRPKNVEGKDG